jgi:hypothetical protein
VKQVAGVEGKKTKKQKKKKLSATERAGDADV